MTLSHTYTQALLILISLLCHMSILAPSCWGWDMPVLSPSRGIYKFSPGVPVEPVGHRVLRDTTGWESGGQVREQEERWKTCSLRPWKASQASRAQQPSSQHNKGSVYQPMFIEPKSTEHRIGREPNGSKTSSCPAPPTPGDEKTEARRDYVPWPQAGRSPRLV